MFVFEISIGFRSGRNGFECQTCGNFETSKYSKARSQRSNFASVVQQIIALKCPSCGSRKLKPKDPNQSLKPKLSSTSEPPPNVLLVCQNCGAETNFKINQ